MKQCPKCQQTYSDDQLNFCLEDGELLTAFAQEPPLGRYADDSPPTMILDQSRVTNPASWPNTPSAQPPAKWQGQQNIQNQPFGSPSYVASRDQTLPTISLILGILSILLICCYGGVWLGVPAAVLGFLGMRNADSNSSRYGGRGLAIGGLVLGVISFLASVVFGLIAILAN
ncbi:MAG: DUF4190 domain-containing protein [Pyrinomonadaceae bacterium]